MVGETVLIAVLGLEAGHDSKGFRQAAVCLGAVLMTLRATAPIAAHWWRLSGLPGDRASAGRRTPPRPPRAVRWRVADGIHVAFVILPSSSSAVPLPPVLDSLDTVADRPARRRATR
jgi:hypothetical protein